MGVESSERQTTIKSNHAMPIDQPCQDSDHKMERGDVPGNDTIGPGRQQWVAPKLRLRQPAFLSHPAKRRTTMESSIHHHVAEVALSSNPSVNSHIRPPLPPPQSRVGQQADFRSRRYAPVQSSLAQDPGRALRESVLSGIEELAVALQPAPDRSRSSISVGSSQLTSRSVTPTVACLIPKLQRAQGGTVSSGRLLKSQLSKNMRQRSKSEPLISTCQGITSETNGRTAKGSMRVPSAVLRTVHGYMPQGAMQGTAKPKGVQVEWKRIPASDCVSTHGQFKPEQDPHGELVSAAGGRAHDSIRRVSTVKKSATCREPVTGYSFNTGMATAGDVIHCDGSPISHIIECDHSQVTSQGPAESFPGNTIQRCGQANTELNKVSKPVQRDKRQLFQREPPPRMLSPEVIGWYQVNKAKPFNTVFTNRQTMAGNARPSPPATRKLRGVAPRKRPAQISAPGIPLVPPHLTSANALNLLEMTPRPPAPSPKLDRHMLTESYTDAVWSDSNSSQSFRKQRFHG